MRVTRWQLRGWFVVVAHSRLLGFWIILGAVALAGAFRVVKHPSEIVNVIGVLGVFAGITRLIARHEGVAALPPPLSAFDPVEPGRTPP